MAEHVIENSFSIINENEEKNKTNFKNEMVEKINILGNKIESLMELNENDLKSEENIELLLNSIKIIYKELFLIKNNLEKVNN